MALSAEQLELRKQGVTGSELGAVVGVSPYATAIDVWRSKCDPNYTNDLSGNPHITRGVMLEEPLIKWYSLITQRTVYDVGTLVHPKHNIVIATPDGVSQASQTDDLVLEIKCPTWRTGHQWGDPGTSDVPEHYHAQVIWEMAVTGLKGAHVMAFMGEEPKIYYVPWDQDLFDGLLEMATRFWQDHVLTGKPPEPDASAGYSDYLRDMFPANRDQNLVECDPAKHLAWVEQLKEAREIIACQERRVQEAQQHLMAAIGEAAGMDTPLGKITWKCNKDGTKTDWKAIVKAQAVPEEIVARHTQTKKGSRPFCVPREWAQDAKEQG